MSSQKQTVVSVPRTMRCLIIGAPNAIARNDVLNKLIHFKQISDHVYLCSKNIESFNVSSAVATYTDVCALPQQPADNSIIVFDHHTTNCSQITRYFYFNRVSCIYICDRYTDVPPAIRWQINYAILFSLPMNDQLLFYDDQIFGISRQVFLDMYKYVCGDSPSDYIVVNSLSHTYTYIKNFSFAITLREEEVEEEGLEEKEGMNVVG